MRAYVAGLRGGLPSAMDLAALLPALAALAVFLVWDANGGGFAPTGWYLGGLVLLAVLMTTLLAYGSTVRLPRTLGIAAVCLTGFTAWSFLSMTWSDVPALAWDGSNRTALYLVVFFLFGILPWRPLSAAAWIGLFAVGVAIVGTVVLVQSVRSADPETFFIFGRLAGPVEYPNGSSGLFLMAGWPALLLASRREVPWAFRGVLLATAGALTEFVLLTQSRGGVASAAVVALLLLAIVPGRVRAVLTGLTVAVAVLPASDALLDVYRVVIAHGDAHAALVRAARAVAWSTTALLIAGLVGGYVDRRLVPSEPRARRLRLVAGTVMVVLAASLLVVAAAIADPVERVRADWHDFTAIPKPYGEGLGSSESHFSTNVLSGNRHDVWIVAWRQFQRARITGAGADNFAVDYLRERRSEQEPRYPFSIELRALGQTGLVGSCLLAAFFLVCGFGLLARGLSDSARVAISGCALIAAQWFAHGSVDIFWEIPGLAAPAFAGLAIAARLATFRRRTQADYEVSRPVSRRLFVAGAATAILLVGTSFMFPWLAAAEIRRADGSWRRDPAAATSELRKARSLNPLSDQADVTAGQIESRRRRWGAMRAAFGRALERNDLNWYSWLELAVVNGYTHHKALALRQLKQAQRLNPTERTLGFVRYRINVGRPLGPREVDEVFRLRFVGSVAAAPPRRP